MRSQRLIALIIALAVVSFGAWWFIKGRQYGGGDSIIVYYTKTDGTTEVPWRVSLGPARDPKSVAFYAAAQALAGPSSEIEAIRFPAGTHVRSIEIDGSVVDVDLSSEVAKSAEGGLSETAEFKSLVWTLTDPKTLPGISAVRVRVDGTRVATLPGGHFELDEPLSRSTF
jgi:spore germination protein GerM